MSAAADMSSPYDDSVEAFGMAAVAAALADPNRSAMCLSMIDGRAWTVGELAVACGIAPSTASEHVEKLRVAGMVQVLRQGRHSYVRIADSRVAELVERIAEHSERQPINSLRSSLRARRLARARVCYDHLAGNLGVAIRDGMISLGLIDASAGLSLTTVGRRVLTDLGVAVPARSVRPLLRDCLDWTERREHLSGVIPATLMKRAIDAGWLERRPDRGIRLDPTALEPLTLLGVSNIEQFNNAVVQTRERYS